MEKFNLTDTVPDKDEEDLTLIISTGQRWRRPNLIISTGCPRVTRNEPLVLFVKKVDEEENTIQSAKYAILAAFHSMQLTNIA